ncbi:MAG: hypothetical protein ACOYCD_06230 [Kiritimatiellia bacterium]|jgi:hypothetical protein
MAVIRRIARWILLLASISCIIPFPSDVAEPVELGSILISILMALLALDMLLLILRVPRRRFQLLFEFVLYPAFIALLLFRLITSNAVSSLMSHELGTLGVRATLLLLFVAIYASLIAAAFIVLLDAKNSYQGKNITHL